MLFTQFLAVMPVYNGQIFIDNNRRVAAIFQNIRFQCGELLPAQRGSSSAISGSTVGVRSVLL